MLTVYFAAWEALRRNSMIPTRLSRQSSQYDLHLLGAKVRHLGTDRNVEILGRIFDYISGTIETKFFTTLTKVEKMEDGFQVSTSKGKNSFAEISSWPQAGRIKWISSVCDDLGIKQKKNRVDIGVRVELPAEIFKHITDVVYESKFVYQTDKYNDLVRTFCMNPMERW